MKSMHALVFRSHKYISSNLSVINFNPSPQLMSDINKCQTYSCMFCGNDKNTAGPYFSFGKSVSSIYICKSCIYLMQNSSPCKIRGCPRGVMVKAMNCGIVVREFVLQSRYYVHFRANTLGKGMNPLILPPAMGK